MNLIVSSIGTSLLTNGASKEERNFLNSIANSKENDLSVEDKKKLENLISTAKEKLLSQDLSYIQKISAELNGIISYYKMNMSNNRNDVHILITTDTIEGQKTADLVKEFLEKYFSTVIIERIEGLTTKDSKSFEVGIKKLIVKLYEIIPGYKNSNYQIIFNLTAGFKITQAYLNIMGMFLADEIDYLFETGKPIKIPKLPIKFTNKTILKKFAAEFSMMEDHQTIERDKINQKFFNEIGRIFYDEIEVGDIPYISLSTWGLLTWKDISDKIYNEELITFPNIKYEPLFIKNFNDSERQNRIKLQKKLGEISQVLLETSKLQDLVQSKGIHYENYKNTNYGNMELGHFRVSKSLRVNCVFYNGYLHLLEFGEHSIENNLNKYKNVINKIKENN